MGWMFINCATVEVPQKLKDNPVWARINRWAAPALFVGACLPPLIGMLVRGSYDSVVMDFLWGGPICVFFVQHVTWSVNSVCHIWGTRPFRTEDASTNNTLVAILGLGEGFHNGHHAFPRSAKHGLLTGQIDLSWFVIKAMEKLGLIEDVHEPSRAKIESKLA
jgi:stearoyl-CoA desaturase (delta-9 desaturase)